MPSALSVDAWTVLSASVKGASHRRDGLPNQDAAACWASGVGAVPISVAVIADGHGGARHFRSAIGARLAVDVTLNVLREVGARFEAADAAERLRLVVDDLPAQIVASWRRGVEDHLAATPLSAAEGEALLAAEGEAGVDAVREDPAMAYGATLLAALATPQGLLLMQLGDGDILAVAGDGTTTRPVPVDERLVGNRTTSICSAEAVHDFRSVVLPASGGVPALLLLSTDGYANSFRSDGDFVQIGRDFLDMVRKQGAAAVGAELPAILEHATAHGSGDDITLALMVAPAAAVRSVEVEPAGKAELMQLGQRLQSAERRVGRLKAALLVLLVAAAGAGLYTLRGDLFAGASAVAKPQPGAAASAKPGALAASQAAATGASAAGEGDRGLGGDVALLQLGKRVADANGVTVQAQVNLPVADAQGCSVQASLWPAKPGKESKAGNAEAALASAWQTVANPGPGGLASVEILVLHKMPAAAKARELRVSLLLRCADESLASTEKVAIGL